MNLVNIDENIKNEDEIAFFSSNDRWLMIKVQTQDFSLEDETKFFLKK